LSNGNVEEKKGAKGHPKMQGQRWQTKKENPQGGGDKSSFHGNDYRSWDGIRASYKKDWARKEGNKVGRHGRFGPEAHKICIKQKTNSD